MSLKSLIQRLLDSRTTPEEAGHNAMPINIANATNLTMAVGAEGSYTAPADGYLSLMVEPGGNINLWGQILPISSFPIQNVQGKLFVPMAKGMEVRYYINGTVSLAKFLKTIGGGYNSFVWRALSCLRALSNYSPRSFCKANPNGLHPRAFQKGECSCQLRLLNMFLLTMDTLAFTKTLRTQGNSLMFTPLTQLIQSLQGFAWALLRDLLHIQKLFLLEKAARSLSLMMQIQSKNYGFRRLSVAINNLGVGGALC